MSVDFWDVKKLYETSSMFGEGSLGIKVSKATQVKKRGDTFTRLVCGEQQLMVHLNL